MREALAGSETNWQATNCSAEKGGRARCGYAWCKKLFKNDVFVHKHLSNKHPEYLKLHQDASVRRGPMRDAFDKDANKPLPFIMTDTGGKYDPEQLSKEIKVAEAQAAEADRASRVQYGGVPMGLNSALSSGRGAGGPAVTGGHYGPPMVSAAPMPPNKRKLAMYGDPDVADEFKAVEYGGGEGGGGVDMLPPPPKKKKRKKAVAADDE